MPTTEEYTKLNARYCAPMHSPIPIVLEKGAGARLWDIDGNEYIDFLSSFSVVNQGHSHPHIITAMVDQSQKLAICTSALQNETYPLLCKKMCDLLGYDMAAAMNSGSEGVDLAIKIARKWAYNVKGIDLNQAKIITVTGNYHGKTLGPLSGSSFGYTKDGFGPFLPNIGPDVAGFDIGFSNIDDMKKAFQTIGKDLAAVLVECVQGFAGCLPTEPGYLSALQDLCREHNVLLIADEIQSGFGRTGTLMAYQNDGIKPDLVIVGKALTGGMYPMSMVLGSQTIMTQIQFGMHTSTFAANPLASAVALAAIDVVLSEDLAGRAHRLGEQLRDRLNAIKNPHTLIERRLCSDYYQETDPSQIQPDGSVDEQLCKIDDIEKSLGRIQGVMETIWVAGDFFMTIPLSFVAEKWGLRNVLWLNLVSRGFMLLWAIIVGHFDALLPTRAIVAGPVLSVLGGDCVFNSLTYALASNLTDDHIKRAIFFGYMSSVSYVVALLGPTLASFTMTISLSLPFWLGISLLLVAIPTIGALPCPEYPGSRVGSPESEGHQREPLLSSRFFEAQDHRKSLLRSTAERLRTIHTIVTSHPRNFSLLLVSFVLTSLASSDTKLLVQYISARYHWTFVSAGYLLSGKAVVNFTLLTIIIPSILRSRNEAGGNATVASVDRANIRYACICLIASVLGALGIAIAAELWILFISLFVYALGSALPIFTLSLLKSPAISPPFDGNATDPSNSESHIFSIVMLVKTCGSLLGAPLMAALWVRGIEIGGAVFGMPYFVSAACYTVALWIVRAIKVD
ncbi:hypothetical protein ACJ41O_006547 [Fusarium nematophilum]